ncbi:uncharacterized protein [Battus philenor]|uniref:uncharacterized protein n=1 Tax=Battus philenor TaxID=42288 RepID=UPI0035CFBFDC
MFPKETIVITGGLILCSISDGFIFGQMSGMVDALLKKDGEINRTTDDVSWIASLINITCICGFGIIALLGEKFGRRTTLTVVTAPVLASYVMIYYGKDKITFLLSRILVGISYGGVLVLTNIAMAEYMDPAKRAIFVNFISSLGPAIGTASGHILSNLLHWRKVALIGLIPTGLSALLPFFWVESPSWLASQGRFEECKVAFRALHCEGVMSERELNALIETERKKQHEMTSSEMNFAYTVVKLKKAMTQLHFWKPIILGTVLSIYRISAGKLMFSTLAITMLQEMTGTPMMFASIGYHGVFLLNAIIVFICFIYLWFYMPETKGRTLQEIELFFKNNMFLAEQNLATFIAPSFRPFILAEKLSVSCQDKPSRPGAAGIVTRYLRAVGLSFHTYALPEERLLRVVARVSVEISADDILADLKQQEIPIASAKRMSSSRTRKQIPLVMLTIELTTEGNKIFEIRRICSFTCLSFVAPHKKGLVGQCQSDLLKQAGD